MKILYGIQTTGNGHLTRSLEIIDELKKLASVEILLSGPQANLELPHNVTYRKNGISFSCKLNGSIDLMDSVRNLKLRRLAHDISSLNLKTYDLVVSDYEPITGWASYFQEKPCIALSNQVSLLSPHTPRPKRKNLVSEYILKNFIPHTHKIGFHYEAYDHFIETPIIKQELRHTLVSDLGHIAVYLPHYSIQRLSEVFKQIPEISWHIFTKEPISKTEENIVIKPIGNSFQATLLSAHGLICGAGFQSTAEALFLGKKLLAIPIKWQYEQAFNAAALNSLGVRTLEAIDATSLPFIRDWLYNAPIIQMHYPDNTKQIAQKIIDAHKSQS